MQYDNPAARLLSILRDGRNIGPTEQCRKAWAGLLNTPKNDHALLMSRLGKLMSLPQEIIDQIKQLFPNQQNTWDHWSRQVNNGFSTQNLNGQWETFLKHIDDHTINYLAISADLIQSKSTVQPLNLENLIELRNKISELLEAVLISEISPEIKKFVIHHLRKILTAIEEYKITGALPILDAVESTFGHAYIDPSYAKFLTNSELGAQILEALAATANFVTVAIGVPQLAQGFALLAHNS